MRLSLIRIIAVITLIFLNLITFSAIAVEKIDTTVFDEVAKKKVNRLFKEVARERLTQFDQVGKTSNATKVLLNHFIDSLIDAEEKDREKKIKANFVFSLLVLTRSRFLTKKDAENLLQKHDIEDSENIPENHFLEDAALVDVKEQLEYLPLYLEEVLYLKDIRHEVTNNYEELIKTLLNNSLKNGLDASSDIIEEVNNFVSKKREDFYSGIKSTLAIIEDGILTDKDFIKFEDELNTSFRLTQSGLATYKDQFTKAKFDTDKWNSEYKKGTVSLERVKNKLLEAMKKRKEKIPLQEDYISYRLSLNQFISDLNLSWGDVIKHYEYQYSNIYDYSNPGNYSNELPERLEQAYLFYDWLKSGEDAPTIEVKTKNLGLNNEMATDFWSTEEEKKVRRLKAWNQYFNQHESCSANKRPCIFSFILLEELADQEVIATSTSKNGTVYVINLSRLKQPQLENELFALFAIFFANSIEQQTNKERKFEDVIDVFDFKKARGGIHNEKFQELVISLFNIDPVKMDLKDEKNKLSKVFNSKVCGSYTGAIDTICEDSIEYLVENIKVVTEKEGDKVILEFPDIRTVVREIKHEWFSGKIWPFKEDDFDKEIGKLCKSSEFNIKKEFCVFFLKTGIKMINQDISPQTVKEFVLSLSLPNSLDDEEFKKILSIMIDGDKKDFTNKFLEYVKKEKPFSAYCQRNQDTCFLTVDQFDGCNDTWVSEHIHLKSQNCRGFIAKGVLLSMLDDIPNYISQSVNEENGYEFKQNQFLASNIKRIEQISTWQDFSLYLGISKTNGKFKECTNCVDEPIWGYSGYHSYYHEKIGFKYASACMKTGSLARVLKSPMHLSVYLGGLLYNITSANEDEGSNLSNWVIAGVDYGWNLREIIEINFGFQKFMKIGNTDGPYVFQINVTIPLSDYLYELIDL